MVWLQSTRSRYIAVAVGSAALGFLVAWPLFAAGQDKKDPPPDPKHAHPADKAADPNKELVEQIKLLQAKVTRLEAAVAKVAPAGGMGGMSMGSGGKSGTGGMGMDMDGMMGGMGGGKKGMGGGGMGMMDDMMGGGPGGMAGMGGMGMMDGDMDMMGMMGMGSMGGMKGRKMKMAAALPGFPGASHLYHIGATDFFLDHPEHITLTTEQQTKLNKAKQKAVADKASAQRTIDQAEQELWELTGAEQPDAAQVEAKVRAVEKLRGDQRLAFIWAVGEAAKVLTDEQRQVLLGTAKPTPKQPHVHPDPKP